MYLFTYNHCRSLMLMLFSRHTYVYIYACIVEFIKLCWHTNNASKQKAKKNYNNVGVEGLAHNWQTYKQMYIYMFVHLYWCFDYRLNCISLQHLCVCVYIYFFSLLIYFSRCFELPLALSKRKSQHTCPLQFLNVSFLHFPPLNLFHTLLA